jgi:hypothetical protein
MEQIKKVFSGGTGTGTGTCTHHKKFWIFHSIGDTISYKVDSYSKKTDLSPFTDEFNISTTTIKPSEYPIKKLTIGRNTIELGNDTYRDVFINETEKIYKQDNERSGGEISPALLELRKFYKLLVHKNHLLKDFTFIKCVKGFNNTATATATKLYTNYEKYTDMESQFTTLGISVLEKLISTPTSITLQNLKKIPDRNATFFSKICNDISISIEEILIETLGDKTVIRSSHKNEGNDENEKIIKFAKSFSQLLLGIGVKSALPDAPAEAKSRASSRQQSSKAAKQQAPAPAVGPRARADAPAEANSRASSRQQSSKAAKQQTPAPAVGPRARAEGRAANSRASSGPAGKGRGAGRGA